MGAGGFGERDGVLGELKVGEFGRVEGREVWWRVGSWGCWRSRVGDVEAWLVAVSDEAVPG